MKHNLISLTHVQPKVSALVKCLVCACLVQLSHVMAATKHSRVGEAEQCVLCMRDGKERCIISLKAYFKH